MLHKNGMFPYIAFSLLSRSNLCAYSNLFGFLFHCFGSALFRVLYHRKNLILTNVTEERYIDPSDYRYRVDDGNDDTDDGGNSVNERIRVERYISQAMIPGSRLVKAEIFQSI